MSMLLVDDWVYRMPSKQMQSIYQTKYWPTPSVPVYRILAPATWHSTATPQWVDGAGADS